MHQIRIAKRLMQRKGKRLILQTRMDRETCFEAAGHARCPSTPRHTEKQTRRWRVGEPFPYEMTRLNAFRFEQVPDVEIVEAAPDHVGRVYLKNLHRAAFRLARKENACW